MYELDFGRMEKITKEDRQIDRGGMTCTLLDMGRGQ